MSHIEALEQMRAAYLHHDEVTTSSLKSASCRLAHFDAVAALTAAIEALREVEGLRPYKEAWEAMEKMAQRFDVVEIRWVMEANFSVEALDSDKVAHASETGDDAHEAALAAAAQLEGTQ